MRADYSGYDILGAALANTVATPAQLAALDRVLTPAEQARVDAWQSGQAEAAQKAEEKKGGPSASMVVGPKGAIVSALNSQKQHVMLAWSLALLGGLVIGGGGLSLLWKAHRVAGFFLGGFLVGPLLGTAAFYAWLAAQPKREIV